MNNLGYDKLLFILPFDHRSSFEKGMFGVEEKDLTSEIIERIKKEKQIIYEGFVKAVSEKISKELAGILVDEQFGDEILKDAKEKGYVTLLTTEKSGQSEFAFEYGDQFGEHIKKYNPIFAKALVHYNPEDEEETKKRQAEQLRRLSDFCHNNGYKFLVEVLIKATESQLANMNHNENMFDRELRPKLAAQTIEEFQDSGVEPDVWKMEGAEKEEDYKLIVEKAKRGGRERVGVIVLGRGAGRQQVEKWITVGARVEGVIGMAVGRTIFWDPIVLHRDGKITRGQVVDQISKNFQYFYDLFINERKTA
ncbi:MAG: hypothetical protein A3C22_02045 [Candidatus Levybacteria bacterium RIFCSPHIGHO2_02_FULL_37_10]|nr:MAG: hypothetical protein A3C22_02045 [Candidatus Levybacteria bacterium RIFCSPHIGHO2_02_FULL_37_10]